MAKNNVSDNNPRLQISGEVFAHVLFWGTVTLIGWLFMTVLEHDRELAKRGVRIHQLEQKMDKMESQWLYYKERLKR